MRFEWVVSLTKRFRTLCMMEVYIGKGIQKTPAIHCLVDREVTVSIATEGMMYDNIIVGIMVLAGPTWTRRLSAAW